MNRACVEPDPALFPILSRHFGKIDPPPNDERCPDGTALATLPGSRSSVPYTFPIFVTTGAPA